MQDDRLWRAIAALSLCSAFYFFGGALAYRWFGWDGAWQAAIDSLLSGGFWMASAVAPFFSERARAWPPFSLGLNSVAAGATSGAAILMFPH